MFAVWTDNTGTKSLQEAERLERMFILLLLVQLQEHPAENPIGFANSRKKKGAPDHRVYRGLKHGLPLLICFGNLHVVCYVCYVRAA